MSEKQKSTNNAYRDGWDTVWGKQDIEDQLVDYTMRAHSQIEQGVSVENTELDTTILD